MNKKSKPASARSSGADPAQQIWLAGLGAFSQAQQQGSEALQKMLQDGLNLQRQAQRNAEQKIADATQKMTAMAQDLAQGKIPQPRAPDPGSWGTLESLFEQRVALALARQGWPSPDQFQDLQARLQALEAQLANANATAAPSPARSRPSRKTRNG